MKHCSFVSRAMLWLIAIASLAPSTLRSQLDGAGSSPDHDRTRSSLASAIGTAGFSTIRFTENRGQVVDAAGNHRPDILYTARSHGMRLYLRRDGISYVLRRWTPDSAMLDPLALDMRGMALPGRPPAPTGTLTTYRVDMELIGANQHAEIVAEEPTGSYSNYYLPQCPHGITGVASYRRLVYREIYPHIDLLIREHEGGLKYDFVVRPGGRVADIRWRYRGLDGATITSGGSLHIPTPLGDIDEDAPYAYDESGRSVACRYTVDDGVFGFETVRYAGGSLVIDPAVTWATYAGGASADDWTYVAGGIAVEPNGDVAITLHTNGEDFPITPNAMQSTMAGVYDIVILKLSNAGALIWSTYWGGSYNEEAAEITTDRRGNFLVCGMTVSPDLPVGPNAHQPQFGGWDDIAIAKLDNTGRMIWGTFLGGSGGEIAHSIAADLQGDVIIAGYNVAGGFPLLSPMQPVTRGSNEVVIAKFSAAGALLWSTYYGGTDNDVPFDLAADPTGDVTICGGTMSANLPMFGAPYQPTLKGVANAFILRLKPDGSPRWSTYFGGSLSSGIEGVAVDGAGDIVIAGITQDVDLPVGPTPFQAAYGGGLQDGFIAKFNAMGGYLWSTYYGGQGGDFIYDVALSGNGDIFLTGLTDSPDFPVTADATQGTINGGGDAFLIRIDAAGVRRWASYYGGSTMEMGTGVGVGGGGVYITGWTRSNDLAAPAFGFQPQLAGGADGFVVRFGGFCALPPPLIVASGPLTLCEGDSVMLDAGAGYTDYRWSPGNERSRQIYARRTGTYSVTTSDGAGCVVTSTPVVVRVAKKPVPTISPAGTITFCAGDSVRLSARQAGFVSYKWSNGDSLDQIWVKSSGAYTVRVVDTNGCEGASNIVTIRVNALPPSPQLSPLDTVWICSDSTLRLDAGAGYASYRWSPTGGNLRSLLVKGPGLYYVDVLDTNGCIRRSDSVVVMIHPRVSVQLVVAGSTDFCGGDSVVLRYTAGAFSSPRWSNNIAGDSLVVKTGGLYWVTVLDSNGCRSRSDSVRVTVRPTPSAAITGPATVCASTRPTYSTPATGTVKYAWSISGDGSIQGSSDAQSITVLWGATGGGRLTLRVTDTVNGCSAESTRDVVIGTELKPVVTPSGSITICAGDSVELDAGAGYTTYIWSNGARSQTIWVKDSAGYSVEVADASGCHGRSDTIRARVEALPQPVIDGPVKVCQSSTASYTTSAIGGATYLWTITNGVVSGGQGTSSVTVQWGGGPVGTVELRVTSASGCIGDAVPVNVEVGSELQPAISASGPVSLCDGDSVELDAGAGYATYLWSTGATSRRIMVKQSGSFSVTVSDATGCSGSSGVVQVTVNQPPVASITPAGPIALRAGDSIELDAGGGYTSYRWSTGSTTQRVMARDSGSYSVTVTDANGCTARASVRVNRVDVIGTAELALGAVAGEPGQRVDVPLLLLTSNDLAAAGARSYSARVRYRASMLEPTGATPRGVLDGDDRVLTVTGDLPAGMTTGELLRLAFIAAMGDTEITPMRLEAVTWRNDAGSDIAITSTLRDGSFTLLGLCTNGGVRLVQTKGALSLRVVRATGDLLEMEYELIESGEIDLSLYDILGREMNEVMRGDAMPGRRSLRHPVSDLPNGLYLLVLRTPTARLSVPVRIVR